MLEHGLFILLALAVLSGALMTIVAKRVATIVMGFFIALIAVGGLFALLHQSFLFFAQMMVSVGGVVVVTLIGISTINLREDQLPHEPFKFRWLLGAAIVVAPLGYLLNRAVHVWAGTFPDVPAALGRARSLGATLFSGWILPFELLSILLLTAMVGVIIIGKKEQAYDRKS